MATQIVGISEALRKELGLYHSNVINSITIVTEEQMKKLVKDSKAKAPKGKRKKHYKSRISSKVTMKTSTGYAKTWYVKAPDYRLTHLILNGHATRNGGRVEGNDFLSPIVEEVTTEYIQKLEEVVSNG